jgi:hypothetical protein
MAIGSLSQDPNAVIKITNNQFQFFDQLDGNGNLPAITIPDKTSIRWLLRDLILLQQWIQVMKNDQTIFIQDVQ